MATASLTIPRRHDLDAVRALAMLLGIALHASLSFATIPWIVQDTRQSDAFTLFFLAIHGFRMPLFFLVSGFFTAMLWRRRGLRALLRQRVTRIVLPLVLGGLTIIPAVHRVSDWALARAMQQTRAPADDGTLVAAVSKGDHELIQQRLAPATDLNAPDAKFGVPPLNWAAMRGDVETLQLLIERGVDVNSRNRDGSTTLLSAAFLGRARAAEFLISQGADTQARNLSNQTPLDATQVDWETTRFLASLLNLPLGERTEVEQGRAEVAQLLGASPGTSPTPGDKPAETLARKADALREAYQAAITSDRLSLAVPGGSFHLIQSPVFAHLWFLWFLCWMVSCFAIFAWTSDRLGWGKLPSRPIISPVRFLWLVPLTLIPQFFMGLGAPSFGPDTSESLIPLPHLLLYYGIFFAFGALYYDADDTEGRLGRWWWLLLPAALLGALPVGVLTMGYRPLTAIAQVVYTWLMCFGTMGLFRRFLRSESKTVRYLSDASYWLYLTHLPLVLAAQVVVSNWPLPALVKFLALMAVVTGALLVAYQTMVRYTWIGTMLNGRRSRPTRSVQRAHSPGYGLETS